MRLLGTGEYLVLELSEVGSAGRLLTVTFWSTLQLMLQDSLSCSAVFARATRNDSPR